MHSAGRGHTAPTPKSLELNPTPSAFTRTAPCPRSVPCDTSTHARSSASRWSISPRSTDSESPACFRTGESRSARTNTAIPSCHPLALLPPQCTRTTPGNRRTSSATAQSPGPPAQHCRTSSIAPEGPRTAFSSLAWIMGHRHAERTSSSPRTLACFIETVRTQRAWSAGLPSDENDATLEECFIPLVAASAGLAGTGRRGELPLGALGREGVRVGEGESGVSYPAADATPVTFEHARLPPRLHSNCTWSPFCGTISRAACVLKYMSAPPPSGPMKPKRRSGNHATILPLSAITTPYHAIIPHP
eukprot:Hpha_TRINITY_DN18753_c0_g1::TRINITY_DN18753_c0_g1_i1::g.47382::m.47382